MTISQSARQWMHALAKLRAQMVRMRASASTSAADALDLADEAVQFIDTLRGEVSTLEKRCESLRAEIGFHEREAQAILQVMPLAVVVTDPQGHIVDANRSAAELLGRSTARLKEELLLHFFDDRAAFSRLLQDLRAADDMARTTLRMRPRERAPFDADITIVRDPRQGEVRWFWCVSRPSARPTPGRTIVLPTAGPSPHHPDAA